MILFSRNYGKQFIFALLFLGCCISGVQAAGTITVSGQISWTDSGGTNTHPVRMVQVQIYDVKSGRPESLLATVETDAQGNYTANVDAGSPGTRDILVRVPCNSTVAKIHAPGVTQVYILEPSEPQRNLGDGANAVINLTTSITKNAGTAFSILEAVKYLSSYVKQMTGNELSQVEIVFPTNESTSQYKNSILHILEGDKWDWDVIMHEYGHHLSKFHEIAQNPGGRHEFTWSLSQTGNRDKDEGTRMAWAEGWPSYFAIAAQQAQGLSAINVPDVGDSHFQDTDDQSVDYDLATEDNAYDSLGEDNEISVQRILYAMSRTVLLSTNTQGLGDKTIWDLLKTNKTKTLSASWKAFILNRNGQDQIGFGTVFTTYRVAPKPTLPANDSPISTSSPTFEWEANGGGTLYRNNRFRVEFYDTNWNKFFTSSELTVTSYTPSTNDWNTIKATQGTQIHWIVTGSNNRFPLTGPYTSKSMRLTR